jgi:hypothetical protein
MAWGAYLNTPNVSTGNWPLRVGALQGEAFKFPLVMVPGKKHLSKAVLVLRVLPALIALLPQVSGAHLGGPW